MPILIDFRFIFQKSLREIVCLIALLVLLAGTSLAQDKPSREKGRVSDIESAWKDLDSPDASLRNAARKKIDAEPFQTLKTRAITETRPWASIEALLALCKACPLSEGATLRPHLCESITTLRIEQMSAEQMLAAIRLTRLVCTRFGKPSEDEQQQMIDLWSHFLPPQSAQNHTRDERQPPATDRGNVEERARERIAPELKELLSLLSVAR